MRLPELQGSAAGAALKELQEVRWFGEAELVRDLDGGVLTVHEQALCLQDNATIDFRSFWKSA